MMYSMKGKKTGTALRAVALLVILLMGCSAALSESTEAAPFTYEHDPRENPTAMRDIVENPDAIYGFSPSPAEDSTLRDYVDAIDWTDAGQVAAAREQRQEYHDSMEELYDMITVMVNENQDIESIARAVSRRRNELRLEVHADDPDGLALVKKRNLETYGNEFGPDQEWLYEKYGSWEMVLIKALGTNPGMDACLGFYDEYYYLYDLEGETQETEKTETAAAEQETRKMETAADADEFIAAFLGEHPEELEGVWAFSPMMEAAVKQMGGIAGMAKQLSALGSPESIMPAYEGEAGGMKVFYVPCVFSAMEADLVLAVQDGVIAGLQTAPFSGGSVEKTESDLYDSLELALPVPSLGELPGILTVPKGEGPFPAVVLLQGSGASDKDEAVGKVKPFRDLAEGLAEKGIAVYRFDKRTYVYGMEMMANRQITLVDEYLEDAVNAVQLLAGQERIDPERIYVLGHSLGGNAIPAVARELENAPAKACGFIMMAASPRPLDVLMREQYDYLYSLMPEITAEQQAEKDAMFAELDKLQDPDALPEDEMVAGAYSAYWKWLADYDIVQTAKEITRPVLLLQGEEDYQVTLEDFEIWKDALRGKENWRMISYPGLTHVFTAGQKAEGAEVYARAEKVDGRVIQDIADFIVP